CAVAAQLGRSLTVMDKPLHIIPAGHGGLEQTLPLEGTKVLMKTGRAMAQVKEALRSEGCYQKAALVENCCLPNQRICRTMDEVPDDTGYFTTILIGE
ncbi:MAG TPA: precorrin-2 C(20)-methyltransferase, partial [Firmicutes bacterium]|nr:precorrin-2 C(20)-methyltransferase [Bacillota bacterium]